MAKKALIVFFLILSTGAVGQDKETQNSGAFEFFYANDVTGMYDQYYTNGVAFSLTLPVFYHSPFNPRWLKNSGYSNNYHTLNFQYDVFTPDLKRELYTDRPFASTMMAGSKHQYVYDEKGLRITSEMRLGIIGQATGAGKLQNGLHDIMPGADRVDGWYSQIRNDIGINYVFAIEKKFKPIEFVEIVAASILYLGVPYTKLDPSLLLRIGLFNDYFDLLNKSAKRDWQAYLIAGMHGSFVAYNATLQGGLFNTNNPYVLEDINHFIGGYYGGIGLAYKNTSLGFSQNFISPEFKEGTSHSWGELRLIFRF